MQIASLKFDAREGIRTAGVELPAGQLRFDTVPGPTGKADAASGPDGTVLKATLDRPLGERGGIMLWFRLERPLLNGADAQPFEATLLTLEGVGSFTLGLDATSAAMGWQFDPPVKGVARALTPGLPGPQWVHLAISWDAPKGEWAAYADGTPLIVPGTRLNPWRQAEGRDIRLSLSPLAVADVRFFDAPLAEKDVAAAVPAAYRGGLDGVLGAKDRGKLDPEPHKGELLYETPLAGEKDIANWRMEGPGVVEFRDGWMEMRSSQPDGEMGHFVHWLDRDFPADVLAEWEVQPLSEAGLCIAFISARGVNGEDIFAPGLAPRDGTFSHYTIGDINSYHVSYYANTPSSPGRITGNMRKNSGFYLVDNGPPGIPAGSRAVHKATALKRGSDIAFAVDGRVVVAFHDDGESYGPALGGGKIGLRQMQWMAARYRNLRVWRSK